MKKFLLTLLVLSSSFLAFSQGKWSRRASMPDSSRCGAIGFSIGNYGYVGLGEDTKTFPFHYFKDFWQFNPSTNSWTRKADFPGRARISPVTFVIGKNVYVVTGGETIYANDFLKECWQYNSMTDRWTQKNNFPGLSRCYAVGFSIGANGYMGTGYDTLGGANPYLRDFWEYDTTTDTWAQKHNFGGISRYYASAFAVNGKGYLCFGTDSTPSTYRIAKDMWAYDPGGANRHNGGGSGNSGDSNATILNTQDVTLSALANAPLLYQNIPNPFSTGTKINYFLPVSTQGASIVFYDSYGNKIKTVELSQTGNGTLNVTPDNLTSGIYSYSLVVNGNVVDTKRMILQK